MSVTALDERLADGDRRTLRAHGLTAVRVTVPAADPAGGIDQITATLTAGGQD